MRRVLVTGVVAAIVFGLAVETYFRLPWTPALLEFAYDEELAYRYRPDQENAVTFLGNYAVQSPAISINTEGFRGPDLERERPIVAVFGSSEVVGPGVREAETLPSRLAEALMHRGTDEVLVLNRAVGGYGPGHQIRLYERLLGKTSVEIAIVRVSSSDAPFEVPDSTALQRERDAKARRDRLRYYVRSAPFVVNRLRAQWNSIRELWQGVLPDRANQGRTKSAEQRVEDIWRRHGATWARMSELAERFDTQLVYFVPNGSGTDVDSLLCERLRRSVPEDTVWEYGPHDFGVSTLAEYQAQYSLGYDPHGNASRYQRLAELLADDLVLRSDSRCREVRGTASDPER